MERDIKGFWVVQQCKRQVQSAVEGELPLIPLVIFLICICYICYMLYVHTYVILFWECFKRKVQSVVSPIDLIKSPSTCYYLPNMSIYIYICIYVIFLWECFTWNVWWKYECQVQLSLHSASFCSHLSIFYIELLNCCCAQNTQLVCW